MNFWSELDSTKKEELSKQIMQIDFKKVQRLYEESKKQIILDIATIEPQSYLEKNDFTNEQIMKYEKIGNELIKSEKMAIVTMAGGQRNKATDFMDLRDVLSWN